MLTMQAAQDEPPLRYVFSRDLRYPYVRNALLVVLLGIVILIIALGFPVPDQPSLFVVAIVLFLFRLMGAGLILMGLVAFVSHVVALWRLDTEVIEVDAQGLKLTRIDKDGHSKAQGLRWEDVTSYTVKDSGDFKIGGDKGLPFGPSGSPDFDGCVSVVVLGVMTLGIGVVIMRWLVPSSRKAVTFNMTQNRRWIFKGFGMPMANFVFDALPRFLPDKAA
jgi:hypothetical protein